MNCGVFKVLCIQCKLDEARYTNGFCRPCNAAYARTWRQKNREKYLASERERGKTRLAERRARYRRRQTPDLIKKRAEYLRAWHAERMQTNLQYRLQRRCRTRLNNFRTYKTLRTCDLIGCTWAALSKHLEAQFQPGMSWDNMGQWHIDHIRPLAAFDLTDIEQMKTACHYTNLQPLWAFDNLSKGSRIS